MDFIKYYYEPIYNENGDIAYFQLTMDFGQEM